MLALSVITQEFDALQSLAMLEIVQELKRHLKVLYSLLTEPSVWYDGVVTNGIYYIVILQRPTKADTDIIFYPGTEQVKSSDNMLHGN